MIIKDLRKMVTLIELQMKSNYVYTFSRISAKEPIM